MEPETEPFYTRIVATFFIFVISLLGEVPYDRSDRGACD